MATIKQIRGRVRSVKSIAKVTKAMELVAGSKMRRSQARALAARPYADKLLEVLGDGKQQKPYIHVSDCVAGMLWGLEHAKKPLNVYNLAPPDVTSIAYIAETCVAASPNPDAKIRYTGGKRGWPGDVPRSRLAPAKLSALGFAVSRSSDEAVELAVEELAREVFGGG